LYIDEDAMDGDVVRGLRSRGIDVLTAAEAGMIRRPDEDHLHFATTDGRALCSFYIGDFQRRRERSRHARASATRPYSRCLCMKVFGVRREDLEGLG
jgi:hypothetical protein